MNPLGEAPGDVPAQEPTSPTEIDRLVPRLGEGAPGLCSATPLEKARLVDELMQRCYELAERLTEAGCRAKGIDPGSELAGEELLAGPTATVHYLASLRWSLRGIADRGLPPIPSEMVGEHPEGSVVKALPLVALDRVRFATIHADVWLSSPPSAFDDTRADFYRRRDAQPAAGLVLGAGNISAIPPTDALHQIFVEGRTCLLKMSPVNEYLGPLYELSLAPLVKRGWLAFVYGGGDVGAYCTAHPGLSSVHITGSAQTYDRIVWGPDAEQAARKERGEPLLQKTITSELGNISPVIVPEAEYTSRELEHLLRAVAGMVVHNASFNCISAKMLVLPESNFGRDVLSGLRSTLRATPTRKAYYPGAAARYDAVTRLDGELHEAGQRKGDHLPWGVITGLDPKGGSPLFQREPFCSVLSVVMLPERDVREFYAAATRFANDKLWGSLAAVVIAPKSVLAEPSSRAALERSVNDLEYGTVSVNAWSGMPFGLSELPWGGAPGGTLLDARSGVGFSHNGLMLEGVKKSIVRAPLAAFPTPFWYANHRSLRRFGRAFLDYEMKPNALRLASIARAAMAG